MSSRVADSFNACFPGYVPPLSDAQYPQFRAPSNPLVDARRPLPDHYSRLTPLPSSATNDRTPPRDSRRAQFANLPPAASSAYPQHEIPFPAFLHNNSSRLENVDRDDFFGSRKGHMMDSTMITGRDSHYPLQSTILSSKYATSRNAPFKALATESTLSEEYCDRYSQELRDRGLVRPDEFSQMWQVYHELPSPVHRKGYYPNEDELMAYPHLVTPKDTPASQYSTLPSISSSASSQSDRTLSSPPFQTRYSSVFSGDSRSPTPQPNMSGKSVKRPYAPATPSDSGHSTPSLSSDRSFSPAADVEMKTEDVDGVFSDDEEDEEEYLDGDDDDEYKPSASPKGGRSASTKKARTSTASASGTTYRRHRNGFVCDEPGCPTTTPFTRQHDLKRHKLTVHEQQRKVQCNSCNNVYSREDALRRHWTSPQTATRCKKLKSFTHLDPID